METTSRLGHVVLVILLGILSLSACVSSGPTPKIDEVIPEGRLYAIAEGLRPGTIVYVHGYMASIASSQPVLRQLEGFGLRVLAFELPGHGQAAGERYTIGEFSDYGRALNMALTTVVERQGDLSLGPTYLVAHSLGAVAVLEALRQGLQADGLVLIAPLLRIKSPVITTIGVNLLSPFTRVLPGGTRVSWFRAYQRWRRQEAQTEVAPWPTTIIIASEKDTVVSNLVMKRFAEEHENTEYQEIPKVNHWEVDSYDSSSPLWSAIDGALYDFLNQGRLGK